MQTKRISVLDKRLQDLLAWIEVALSNDFFMLCIPNGEQNKSFATDLRSKYLLAHQYRIGEESFYYIINL